MPYFPKGFINENISQISIFRRVKTLEEKFIQLGNNLRSMERYEIKSNERGTEIQQKIEELEKKVAEVIFFNILFFHIFIFQRIL